MAGVPDIGGLMDLKEPVATDALEAKRQVYSGNFIYEVFNSGHVGPTKRLVCALSKIYAELRIMNEKK